MPIRTNPFHDLYVGESVGPDKFVNLFSDVIVNQALLLFQPGHVVLKGTAGSGKSMLLNLLKPSIRIAYETAEQTFPVPGDLVKFIGAGINLKRSGISDFGQRPIANADENDVISPIYFGDFLNYWVVSDIFRSIKKFSDSPFQRLKNEIGLQCSDAKFDAFASKLAQLDCWTGYLKSGPFANIEKQINGRITQYRAFLNYNVKQLSDDIQISKTLVGVPISQTVQLLKECELLQSDTEIFIRIDQYEELAYLDDTAKNLGTSYREIIHKLLGMRDTNVSYRVGTRHYSWTGDEKMFGSEARLERKRNYSIVSLDTVLRRPENARTWIFPAYAEDIFSRRIKHSQYKSTTSRALISEVFGNRMSPSETAQKYVPSDPTKALSLEENWPENWTRFLTELAKSDPLSARLGEAWARQKGKEDIVNQKKFKKPFLWEEKKWWKKERTEQALVQIASRNRQQLIWYGKDDLLGLSGGHILIFLSLCQHIWDVWLRDKRNEVVDSEMLLPTIDFVVQSVGIREASKEWFDDISNGKGGRERKVFINYLGNFFYKLLVEDKAMSYPGRNGFSMTIEEFEKHERIYNFINDACNFGELYDAPHTTKLSDKKTRRKWYLSPIFSPHFKIPFSHTKEPLYADVTDVASWLIDCGLFERGEFVNILNEKKRTAKEKKGKENPGNSQASIVFE